MFSPEFYRKNIMSPEDKNFRHLYLVMTEQPDGLRGRMMFPVYCPENSLAAAKRKIKSWADDLTRNGCCVIFKSVVKIEEKNGA
jgi:hypothetical protein